MKIINHKEIEIYSDEHGYAPFVDWLASLKDRTIRARIRERLDRVRLGNFGDHKALGNGVCEIRFKFGSGYRIYYGEQHGRIILLLCGGDKSSQTKDIKKAKLFWQTYLER